jgi:hypothetical protein
MFRLASLIALAGCGRIGFEAVLGAGDDDGGAGDGRPADMAGDVVPLGHDEDGDGIPDNTDPCPHLSGTAADGDGDGDGVGDACDPNLGTGGDAIAAFYTMVPGDQPFTTGLDDAVWIQNADSFEMAGDQGADNNLYGKLSMSVSLGSARVTIGFDLTQVVPVTGGMQNQIALAVHGAPPLYIVEMNQFPGMFSRAEVVHYDGTNFNPVDFDEITGGMHTGPLTFDAIHRVNTGVAFNSGWPGEGYTSQVSDTIYQGADTIELNCNNVHFEIRYLIVITSP